MKNTVPVRHTIRFRRWSRKAYAAFASIGRCVTIGCLRKSVADSSLSKQKAKGTAGHIGCCDDCCRKGMTEGSKTTEGIPPGLGIPLDSATAFIRNTTVLMKSPHVLYRIQPCTCRQQVKSTRKQRNYTGTDYRNLYGKLNMPYFPGNPCLLFIHYYNNRKI